MSGSVQAPPANPLEVAGRRSRTEEVEGGVDDVHTETRLNVARYLFDPATAEQERVFQRCLRSVGDAQEIDRGQAGFESSVNPGELAASVVDDRCTLGRAGAIMVRFGRGAGTS